MADDDARARRTSKAAAGGPARKAAVKKAAVKKAAVKKAVVKKAGVTASAASARKAAAPRKAPVKRTAAPAAAAARKTPAKRTTAREAGAILAPRKKAPPKLRLAAEETFDDDWKQPAPEPEPTREDPGARLRARIRAAARSLEEKEAAAAQPSRAARPFAAAPEPPAPRAPDEPVTRVLVAPMPPELDADEEWRLEDDPESDEALDEELDETLVEEEVDDEEEEDDEAEDWAPPEVLDDTRSFTVPSPPPPSPPAGPLPPPPPIHRTPEAEVSVPPPPVAPEPPADKKTGGGGGLSVLAIILALVGPVIGAVIGLVLAGRARARGSALAGPARAVSVLALVGWLVGAGVLGYVVLRDDGVDYSKLAVGDCFDSSQSNEIRGIEVEPCSEAHNSEIFFVVNHPAGPGEPYPGKDTLVQFAADACLGQPLTDYLGVPLEQSQLKDFEIVPQESAWDDGRRVLLCGVDTGGQGDLTGSVKGTRR